MLLIDFTNAFNLVDGSAMLKEDNLHCPNIYKWVEFCYSHPARLYYNEHTLSTTKGVQQGDPLGPLFFALTLHPLAIKIAARCALDFHAWYLDDGTIAGDTLEVAKALKIIQKEGPERGLVVNINKTEIFWPSPDPRSNMVGVFPSTISRHVLGVKLLGRSFSQDQLYCSNMVVSRVEKTVHLMSKVQQMNDSQCELLLLRNCIGVSKLYFTLRTTNPMATQYATSLYDQHLIRFLRQLVVEDDAGFGPVRQRLATLPIKYGGFGVYTMEDTGKYCYLASYAQTLSLQHNILKLASPSELSTCYEYALQTFTQAYGTMFSNFDIRDAAPQFMKSLAAKYFDFVKETLPLNEREGILWQHNREKHAMDFLKSIPIVGLNQTVGTRQLSAVLQYRLGIPFFEAGSSCSVCRRPIDQYGDHAIHCASEVGIKFRHDMVRDGFADICYKGGVAARKEASLGFLTNSSKSAKPADVLVYNWIDGKDVCFDVTGVSPFTSARTRSFTPGHAISAAVSRKLHKYQDLCARHGYDFQVLTFTSLGELSEDTITFIKRLRNCFVRNDTNYKIGNSLFHKIAIIIQKGVDAQLVARLPTISCNIDLSIYE
ncbi:uncharacterized protein LOC113308884 [Papaver somniferum]|uniref:uncharacterized protein LOC113308884 n=1 Tax=Papaver somniferum TaxID=3469 RepID=UPI000E6F5D8A|nr:uncharacterized protein LOC113308884 [Papaver somniferum]XP_026413121.1 uncharacterized protein LOC113308884 [Papaver somniferum]XP_026413123.1 uncharacterized protein LOC113308884 [Papaver somniferum]XP_026413124.1 uncharacterized protein LOC113308884 [Papaver somniferum]XP_026413125.1 uncharacterized protein LOC113308884 [Papaver somniferum]